MRRLHQEAEASLLTYGPDDHPDGAVEVVETFGNLELEYAAIRKHCALFDEPYRAVLALTGPDRIDFLNRMITQELKGMAPFHMRRSFWLNTKGRIDADLRVIDLPTLTLLELDVHAAERTLSALAKYIITEDVQIEDWTQRSHRLGLHGPSAPQLLASLAQTTSGAEASGPSFEDLQPDRVCVVTLFGVEVMVYREDQCGEVGLELIVPAKHALPIFQQLIESASTQGAMSITGSSIPPTPRTELARKIGLRPAGWHAFNIARIESGTPIYNLDFGSNSLPAETGVIKDRVSFTKGCYLGQEIVARMHARGHPKQCLVALKFESSLDPAIGLPRMPMTGASLCLTGATDTIGQVTSSALSPMLSSAPIALAQVRFAHCSPGTVLTTVVDGVEIKGVIQPTLASFSRKDPAAH
jgi:aminomethyltransferase